MSMEGWLSNISDTGAEFRFFIRVPRRNWEEL
jgi:hypothetical protein